jgi:hypothetical protein
MKHSDINTETEYMNGGVTANLIRLFIKDGYKATPDELLTMAAHDAMPRDVFYTESQLADKRREIEQYADAIMPSWRNDEYLDLYGVPTPSSRSARMSAYDKLHSTRK